MSQHVGGGTTSLSEMLLRSHSAGNGTVIVEELQAGAVKGFLGLLDGGSGSGGFKNVHCPDVPAGRRKSLRTTGEVKFRSLCRSSQSQLPAG